MLSGQRLRNEIMAALPKNKPIALYREAGELHQTTNTYLCSRRWGVWAEWPTYVSRTEQRARNT